MRPTKIDRELAAAEHAHSDDPLRAELLRRARRFKSSWIELAEVLTEARRSNAWRAWGFDSFHAYAKTELHLREETVDKLTGSFHFLKQRAPEVIARARGEDHHGGDHDGDGSGDHAGATARIPTYQAIDFLRRAEERASERDADVSEETVAALRKRVLDDGAGLSAITREYGDAVFPIDEATRRRRDAAGILNVANRLKSLLAESDGVPKRLAGEVHATLDRLIEVVRERAEKAA